MAYTEFFATQRAGASDLNGGGPRLGSGGGEDGYILELTDTQYEDGEAYVFNDGGTGWPGVLPNDYLLIDIEGTKQMRRVSSIDGDYCYVQGQMEGTKENVITRVGGAWATLQRAADVVHGGLYDSNGNPPRVNIKNDAVWTENILTVNDGTAAFPVTFEGYETTPGDGGVVEIDGDGLGVAVVSIGHIYNKFKNIYAHTSDAGFAAFIIGGNFAQFVNCQGLATGAGASSFYLSAQYVLLVNCYSPDSAAYGFRIYADSMCIGCIALSAGTIGFATSSHRNTFVNCLSISSGEDCFMLSTSVNTTLINCVGYGSVSESGAKLGASSQRVVNCIFVDNNQYGIESNNFDIYEDYNAFYNNGAGERFNIIVDGLNDITLTGDPFVNAAGGDFALNNTAGAGAACKAKGFPGALLDGVNTGYSDIGALQNRSDVDEIHLIKALTANKRAKNVSTGVTTVYDDDGTTPVLTLTPSNDGTDFIITAAYPNIGTPGDPDNELHDIKAYFANKKVKNIATGILEVMDDDGVTPLYTLTPATDAGVTTVTPS